MYQSPKSDANHRKAQNQNEQFHKKIYTYLDPGHANAAKNRRFFGTVLQKTPYHTDNRNRYNNKHQYTE